MKFLLTLEGEFQLQPVVGPLSSSLPHLPIMRTWAHQLTFLSGRELSFAANQFALLVSPAKGSATFFDGLVGTLGTGSLGVAVAGVDICMKGGGGSAVTGGEACMASVMNLWRKVSWATREEMDSSTLAMLNWEAGTVLSGIHLMLKSPILLSPPVSSLFLSLYCGSVLIGYKYSVFPSHLDSR